jgi:hypothetical protein
MAQDPAPTIASSKDAISVMDFEPLARKALPPAHWGYLATGVDDDLTLRMNREAMLHYQLRARRLSGVAKADLKTEVFGASWDMPIYVSAVGSQKQFHPEGELATARAAKGQKAMQMLSTVTSTSVEEVAKVLGAPPWYQLYMPTSWAETEKLVKRVEAAGCPVLVWTIDVLAGRHTETATRLARMDTRDCFVLSRDAPDYRLQRGTEPRPAHVRRTVRRNESAGRGLDLRRPPQDDDRHEAGPPISTGPGQAAATLSLGRGFSSLPTASLPSAAASLTAERRWPVKVRVARIPDLSTTGWVTLC